MDSTHADLGMGGMSKRELVGLRLTRLHPSFHDSLHPRIHACVCAFALFRSTGCMARCRTVLPGMPHTMFSCWHS